MAKGNLEVSSFDSFFGVNARNDVNPGHLLLVLLQINSLQCFTCKASNYDGYYEVQLRLCTTIIINLKLVAAYIIFLPPRLVVSDFQQPKTASYHHSQQLHMCSNQQHLPTTTVSSLTFAADCTIFLPPKLVASQFQQPVLSSCHHTQLYHNQIARQINYLLTSDIHVYNILLPTLVVSSQLQQPGQLILIACMGTVLYQTLLRGLASCALNIQKYII